MTEKLHGQPLSKKRMRPTAGGELEERNRRRVIEDTQNIYTISPSVWRRAQKIELAYNGESERPGKNAETLSRSRKNRSSEE